MPEIHRCLTCGRQQGYAHRDVCDKTGVVLMDHVGIISTDEEPKEYEWVTHPKHYNEHPSGVECIDIVRHYGFNIGSVIKYLWRAGLKPGQDTLRDLKKAAFYLNDEIERIEKEQGES